MQHFERVPCAVSQSKHDGVRLDIFRVVDDCAGYFTVSYFDTRQFRLKANLSAQRDNFAAKVLNDLNEIIRTDVRFGLIEYFIRCSGSDKFLKNFSRTAMFILYLRGEFPVGKRTGTALAELHIRGRVKLPVTPEIPDILYPRLDILSSFYQYRFIAELGKDQSGKKAAGTASDDDGPKALHISSRRHPVTHVGGGRNLSVL